MTSVSSKSTVRPVAIGVVATAERDDVVAVAVLDAFGVVAPVELVITGAKIDDHVKDAVRKNAARDDVVADFGNL